jgi:hypothetical protein
MQEFRNNIFKEGSMDLLHKIAHCPNIQHCFDTRQSSHPCFEIISVQHSWDSHILGQHQVPEPWSGDIEHAPILFLGSNPAIDEQEEFPLLSWPDEWIEDFFTHRYQGGRKQWIENGTRYLRLNGSRGQSDFWSDVRKLAEELRERVVDDGVDYALTEVVHCKSKNQKGVKKALHKCAGLYLRRVVELSGAKVIVVLGEQAEDAMRSEFPLPDGNIVGLQSVGGRQRYIVFLYHPSYCRRPDHRHRKPCFFGELDKEKLQELRVFLNT